MTAAFDPINLNKMNRPKITREAAEALLKTFGHTEKFQILAIRGYYLDSMGKPGVNDLGIYDDAICLISPDYFGAFNGNTDPSKKIFGIASVLAPQTIWYRKGLHGLHHLDTQNNDVDKEIYDRLIKSDEDVPGFTATYWAFRQDSNVTVTRFGKEGTFTDRPDDRFWIDLHRGGEWTTSSEGCQTIILDEWEEFKMKGYMLMDHYGQERVPYCLIDTPQKS